MRAGLAVWLSSQLWSEPPILTGRPHCKDFRHLAPSQILSKVRGGCWCNSGATCFTSSSGGPAHLPHRAGPLPTVSLLIQLTGVHNHMGSTLTTLPGQTILDTIWEQWCVPYVPWTPFAPCILCAWWGCMAPSLSHLPDGQTAGKSMVRSGPAQMP